MKQLIIDIGNTRIKSALFNEGALEEIHYFSSEDYDALLAFVNESDATQAILSTTQKDHKALETILTKQFDTIIFTAQTPLPISISYQTPETLGDDRKAAVCGAHALVGNQPFLVITAGTCITYNYFDGKTFVGGGISPGLQMRYRAMNEFTGNLPLVEKQDFDNLVGTTTLESLQSGVRQGIVAEMDGIIQNYQLLQPNLKVFICGGDTDFFESRLKYEIFASSNLVLDGLHQILDYNFNR